MRSFLILSFLFLGAVAQAEALTLKGFNVLTLGTPVTEHFILSNFLLEKGAEGTKLVLSVRTAIDGKVYSIRSKAPEHADADGRWVEERNVAAVEGTAPRLEAWKVPFAEMDLAPGANLIQYELQWLSADGVWVSIAQSSVYSITVKDAGYEIAPAPAASVLAPPVAKVEEPTGGGVPPGLGGRKLVVLPYSSWEKGNERVVYYATNRTTHWSRDTFRPWTRFESLLHEYAEKRTLLGACRVRVPAGREPGEMIPEGPDYPKAKTVGLVNAVEYYEVTREKDTNRLMAYQVKVEETLRKEFFTELKGRPILLYIHGFNSSFESVVQRAAQVKTDLKWKGSVVAYAWASLGRESGYLDDLSNVRDSYQTLADFLVELKNTLPDQPICVLVHSMGNFLFLNALQRINFTKPIFQRVVLAAPDVARGDFQKLAPRVAQASEKVAYYFSAHDSAVLASKILRGGGRRAGRDKTPVDGIDTIDASPVTKFNEGFGHSYFGTVKAALADISYFLVDGMTPGQRHGATLLRAEDGVGWKLIAPR